ncbi:MAG: hypothetical protein JHC95_09050 [Solirubrobacteraceae bacterium]|nr:hypothetical protein [Solirubrobacteraceae bacterium]
MDYVEFRIGGNVLRALSPPSVELPDDGRVTFPRPGSRDALCEMIDTTVESAAEAGELDQNTRRVEVRTCAGHVLTIPLDTRTGERREWAQLVPADARGRLQVSEMFVW